MGKRRQNKNKSDNEVIDKRQYIFDKINNCRSYNELSKALDEYKRDKKQGKYTFSGDVSEVKKLSSVRWHQDINETIRAQKIKYPDPVPQDKRRKELTRVTAELGNIAEKCKAMPKDSSYDEARGAVRRIHDAISDLAEKYVKDGDLTHFQVQTKELLKEDSQDMRIVNTHRGYMKNIFGNIGLFILGLGVGYLAVCAYRGSFFTFNTDSANRVEALQTEVNAVRVIG